MTAVGRYDDYFGIITKKTLIWEDKPIMIRKYKQNHENKRKSENKLNDITKKVRNKFKYCRL
jgi:hypothetical protein